MAAMPSSPRARALQISSGNYASRVDGATFVMLGEATVYFADGKPIALAAKDVLYRIDKPYNNGGVLYKRLRTVSLRHSDKSRIHVVGQADLQAMVEAAVMTMASNLVDERIKGR